jgi:hypothetical protein
VDDQTSVSGPRLMGRAQSGDREAFHELFKDIGPFITRSLQRRLLDVNEVEDICQEVMVAVYKSRHTYQPDRPFEPWLMAIIRNGPFCRLIPSSGAAKRGRRGGPPAAAGLCDNAFKLGCRPFLK